MSIVGPVRAPIAPPVASAFGVGLPWQGGGGPVLLAPAAPTISGAVTIGGTLTALGPVTKWQRAATWGGGGSYSDIGGATSQTYSPVSADIGYSLRAVGPGGNSNALIYDPATVSAVVDAFKIRTLSAGALASLVGVKGAITLAQGTGSKQPIVGATSFNSTVGLTFDGIDDFLASQAAANFSAAQSVRVVAGIIDTTTGLSVITELGTAIATAANAFVVAANQAAGAAGVYTSSTSGAFGGVRAAGVNFATADYYSMCADSSVTNGCAYIRKAGVAQSLTNEATGCTPPAPLSSLLTLYVGMRAGTSLPWAGTLGGALMYLAGNAEDGDLADAEAYVKNGCGL